MKLLALPLLLWIFAATAAPFSLPLETLGIAPQDEAYYRGGVIKCRNGSGKFTRDQLNDDFCDCADGTDEPGTSACPEGKFYCQNAGHSPITIFSSWVNDGICDCCDGSDEYGSNTTCKNTCWEAGKAAREKLKKKVATYKSGVVIRNQEVEKAKVAIAKDEAELTKLKGEEKILQGLVDKLKEQKRLIEKAEEEERLIKEKEEKRIKEEAEKKAAEEKKAPDASQEADSQDTNQNAQEGESKVAEHHDGHVTDNENHSPESGTSVEELDIKAGTGDDALPKEMSAVPTKEQDLTSVNSEGLSKEDLGRLVASRWTGENVDDVGKGDKKGHEDELDIPEPAEEGLEDVHDIPEPAEENYAGYHSEVEDDRHKFDDDLSNASDDEYADDHEEPDESYKSDDDHKSDSYKSDDDHKDLTASGQASWLDKIQQTAQNVLQKFNFFKTPVDLSEASHVRKEYDDASTKLSKIQSRITTLTDKLKQDFGNEKEFYYFYDQCFEGKEGKYVYKVCPYKKASQVEGHSSTNLGRWDKFEESYRIMHFSNGDKCWNGPDRSLKVRLRCGLNNELNGVDEPSRCEYVAVLSTPALCVEEKLKELQQKLDSASSDLPGHDEL
ncbi:glucosidase 2 subunit beta isoform X3 [Brachypodium distachyon]|uniref:glucosidase 2 subunit beta isoform X3 n=1 Tax=Brachypodium distachyon TaxID=15368 RepID=UPI00052FE21E|nr:glucosidase 2 subunit beta isoform X3 [Brachypodium distachyon]|eukprot:XP_010230777.1 glucosidase 2 subunit beta isoform X3 [Brachypodium distachyon]